MEDDKAYCVLKDMVFVYPNSGYLILVGRLINRSIRTLAGTRPFNPVDYEDIQTVGLEFMTEHEAYAIQEKDSELYARLDNAGLIPKYK